MACMDLLEKHCGQVAHAAMDVRVTAFDTPYDPAADGPCPKQRIQVWAEAIGGIWRSCSPGSTLSRQKLQHLLDISTDVVPVTDRGAIPVPLSYKSQESGLAL
jgi:hypothetical protein